MGGAHDVALRLVELDRLPKHPVCAVVSVGEHKGLGENDPRICLSGRVVGAVGKGDGLICDGCRRDVVTYTSPEQSVRLPPETASLRWRLRYV